MNDVGAQVGNQIEIADLFAINRFDLTSQVAGDRGARCLRSQIVPPIMPRWLNVSPWRDVPLSEY
jgi:putative protein kinase ArgK-like GTPase of G3E family